MPIGLNSIAIQGWYKLPELAFGKSIQPSYRFFATFLDNPFRQFDPDIGSMPIITPYHFQSISIPTYQFTLDKVFYGIIPRAFPTLNQESLTISVNFEEDENGTIAYFINWMQKCIVDSNGYYKAPSKNRIGNLVVEVQDRQGIPSVYYIFKNLSYVTSDSVSFDYAAAESIKYNITFSVEFMETWYVKACLINGVKTEVLNALPGVASNIASGIANKF